MQHTGALPCREAGFRAMIHVAVSEPLLSRGGGIRSHWTCGSPRAHLEWVAGSSAMGHVAPRGCSPRSLS
jgi:hypothetical protein